MRILPAHQLIEAALDGRDVEQRAVGEAIVLAYVDLERPVVYPPITAHRGGLGRAVPPHAHELLDRIVRYPEPVTAAGSTTRFVPTGSYRRARWFAPKAFGAEVVRMSLIEVTPTARGARRNKDVHSVDAPPLRDITRGAVFMDDEKP